MPDIDDDLTEIPVDAELADRLRDAQQAYDEVKEYLESIKDEIKARYADAPAGIRGVHNGETVFTCVKRESTRINSTKLKRDYPEVWHAYAKTSTSQYLTIARLGAAS